MHDVRIYAAGAPEKCIAGLIATGGIAHSNFHRMINIVFISEGRILVYDENAYRIDNDNLPLLSGKYYLSSTNNKMKVNGEAVLTKTRAKDGANRTTSFRSAVQKRDMGCIISGLEAPNSFYNSFSGFQAAHIFPVAYGKQWKDNKFDDLVTIPPVTPSASKINSIQNGMLLSDDIHFLFDSYEIGIDPDVCVPTIP